MYRYSIKKAGPGKNNSNQGKGKISNFLKEMPFPAAKGIMANQL
ncbi:hypothetical protein EC2872800_0806 [Escherichia coli 2872800]|nr:hypothetical protein ECBCE034MS14_0790 [Escherichia coli BCE034_MS-14]EMV41711.1 hypothetical protein EC2875000_0753 [Escherichia coli 2875000]EMV48570.1 hypothetical protein EC2872800_0806 [Escherichia coli 2872800]EMV62241.1 hypothetical protein EC2867750_0736 [Escherichia coli 2867750]EMV75020.1 hypothetical protein EC2866750_2657 [Escherichia coli 2866750]EMV77793.1 hypothetical protein EC2866550_0731 [Escherichia coli 2866550]EMV78019.1 hypothetical protein EC2866450_0763 [Escherichia